MIAFLIGLGAFAFLLGGSMSVVCQMLPPSADEEEMEARKEAISVGSFAALADASLVIATLIGRLFA